MNRKILDKLYSWYKNKADRKPLILLGARQVGKTWLVRYLAEQLKLELCELNFERDPKLKTLFVDNDPQKVLVQLETWFNKAIDPEQTLLFLDEIQAAPELLAKLRWFAEEKPELAVIATGSLLDFALDEHEFSMPVGRVSYLYLEPMSFEEFLLAQNQNKLCEFLNNFVVGEKIPAVIHDSLSKMLREYIFVGGMPAVVENWALNKSMIGISEMQQNILRAYRDDFSKYAKRIAIERLDDIFKAIPRLLGKKFKYSAVNKDVRFEVLKKALNLLCKARVCHKVFNCSAGGIPLDANIKEAIFKTIFLDVGLVSASMGLSFNNVNDLDNANLINEGGIAEQLVGQLLRSAAPAYLDPKLYYWAREKTGAESEVDYLIQSNWQIIPVEVKAGATGALRSLHTFMYEKKSPMAIRLNADEPSIADVKVKNHQGKLIEYKLLSLPIYFAEQIYRLIKL